MLSKIVLRNQQWRNINQAFVAALSLGPSSKCNISTNSLIKKKSSMESKPIQISSNLSFRPAFDSHIKESERPLVLVYGWLVAKARHAYKYGDFYLHKGFDVLHIKILPQQVLRPVLAQRVMGELLDFVCNQEHKTQPLLVHGFSVGGYLYGETLVKILENPELYGTAGARLRGQILDSPVDYQGIPFGISRALTTAPVLQNVLEISLDTYLKTFYNGITRHYHLSSETFRKNSLKVPTLLFCSDVDQIGPKEAIYEVGNNMKKDGIEVYLKCFKESPHVSHFHYYPVEYITELNQFLSRIRVAVEENENGNLNGKIHSVN